MPIENVKNNPVSRAEEKLACAVQAFSYDFRGKKVLDIGSSTGGFTEFALKSGAKQVVAIEKGTRQMKAPLRFDERVDLHEKTDIFSLTKIDVPDVILADVSFVSLTKVLLHAQKYLADEKTDFLVMLKPQFEAKPQQLHKGIVKNERVRRDIIQNFEYWLRKNDFLILQKKDNNLAGRNGNLERFYWLKMIKKC